MYKSSLKIWNIVIFREGEKYSEGKIVCVDYFKRSVLLFVGYEVLIALVLNYVFWDTMSGEVS
jgi:hypothetical protein